MPRQSWCLAKGNIISVLDLWLRSALQKALWWLSIGIIGMVWKMMNTNRTFFSRWRSWSDINSWMKRCHKRLLWSCEPCCYAVCVKLHFSSRRSYSSYLKTIWWLWKSWRMVTSVVVDERCHKQMLIWLCSCQRCYLWSSCGSAIRLRKELFDDILKTIRSLWQ